MLTEGQRSHVFMWHKGTNKGVLCTTNNAMYSIDINYVQETDCVFH